MTRLALALAALVFGAAPSLAQKRIRAYPGEPMSAPQPPKPDLVVPENTNPDPKSLDYGEVELSKARTLVRQLGSRDYKEREAATRELGKLGRATAVVLREIIPSETNPEVQLRAKILLPRAEADDVKARVFCFLADKDGRFDHKLPGWTRFREIAGADKSARELFADVLRKTDYHAMLLASEKTADEAKRILSEHYRAVQYKQNTGTFSQFNTSEIAVLTFLECSFPEKELKINGLWGGEVTIGHYMSNAEVQNAMRDGSGKFGPALQRIVTKWMESRETLNNLQQAMNLAQQWGLKDRYKYAAKMLTIKDNNQPWGKAQAALQIVARHEQSAEGKAETVKYLPLLATALDDANMLTQAFIGGNNPNNVASIHLQDYVLGLLCKVTKQNPADYGLDRTPNVGDNFQNYANWCFRDSDDKKADDKRKAGIKKFKEWAEKNLKADEPKKDVPAKKDAPNKGEPQPAPMLVGPPVLKK